MGVFMNDRLPRRNVSLFFTSALTLSLSPGEREKDSQFRMGGRPSSQSNHWFSEAAARRSLSREARAGVRTSV